MDKDQEMAERGPARSGPRDSLFLLTNLATEEGKPLGRARVRNLSATGLMADCERPVPADAAIVLDLRGVGRVSGRVVWSKDGKIGIAFDHEIDPALARKPVASGSTSRAPSYLRLHQIGR
ncbi:PilZ domain-containing protein [Sphingobium sp. TomMM35A]